MGRSGTRPGGDPGTTRDDTVRNSLAPVLEGMALARLPGPGCVVRSKDGLRSMVLSGDRRKDLSPTENVSLGVGRQPHTLSCPLGVPAENRLTVIHLRICTSPNEETPVASLSIMLASKSNFNPFVFGASINSPACTTWHVICGSPDLFLVRCR